MTCRTLAATLLLLAAGCTSDGDEPNEAPITAPDEVTTNEDTPITIPVLANDSDPDEDELSIRNFDRPEADQGTIRREGNSLVFEPAAEFNGDVELEYVATDGNESTPATLVIHVAAVNDAPVAVAQTLATGRNEPITITLGAVDIDGDALDYEVVEGPAHGTLTGTAPNLVYTPATGYSGPDSLRFIAGDRELSSAETRVDITVAASATPTASSRYLNLSEDTALDVTLTGSDPDGDALTFDVVQQPVHGTLSGTGANLTYTPAANYNGVDVFYFTVNDGVLTSNAARVDLHVNSIPDAPVANAVSIATNEDVTLWGQHMAGSDSDGDTLAYSVVDLPDHGQINYNVSTGTFSYVPQINYNGSDSFTYTVSDGTTTSDAATVAITVASVPDKPQVQNDWRTLNEDGSVSFTLFSTDVDGNPSTFTHTSPGQGTLTGEGANLVYTPPPNYNGTTSFTFTASDDGGSSSATFTLYVLAVNDAPVANAATIEVTEDVQKVITLPGSDIDSASVTYDILNGPTGGVLTGGPGAQWTYTPDLDRNSEHDPDDFFTYRITDSAGLYATATITLEITPVQDHPKPLRDIVELTSSELIPVLANDDDPDWDYIDLISVGAPSHGTTAIEDITDVRYTPAAGFTGTDTFTYTVRDPYGQTGSATVYVGVGVFPTGVPLLAVAPIAIPSPTFWDTDLSANGRYVAFVTSAALRVNDNNQVSDVYVLDRVEATYELISVDAGGHAVGGARRPSISDDGRYVAFTAGSPDMVPGDTTGFGFHDLFVRDRVTDTTVLASVSTAGVQATSFGITQAAISGDGRHVAFTTRAYELVAGDANSSHDVFVRDLDTGVTERVSLTATGVELDLGADSAERIAIDADGSVIAFASSATGVVDDAGTGKGLYVRDRTAATTTRVGKSTANVPANGDVSSPALSADGSIVAFVSPATNLIPSDTNNRTDVFVHDRATGNTYRSPWDGANADAVTISADGRYLGAHFTTNGPGLCLVIDRIGALTRNVGLRPDGTQPTTGSIGRCTLSADAKYASYVSSAPDLGADWHRPGEFAFVAPVVW
jgi:hypothetical protein